MTAKLERKKAKERNRKSKAKQVTFSYCQEIYKMVKVKLERNNACKAK